MHRLNLNGYEPDRHHEAAVAFCIHAGTDELTSPVHQHRKGQLILALHGAITCTVENALWMVPPQYAVWIPGGVEHSNQVTANAELCFLFIEPSAVTMPTTCCTLKISPSLSGRTFCSAADSTRSPARPARASPSSSTRSARCSASARRASSSARARRRRLSARRSARSRQICRGSPKTALRRRRTERFYCSASCTVTAKTSAAWADGQ